MSKKTKDILDFIQKNDPVTDSEKTISFPSVFNISDEEELIGLLSSNDMIEGYDFMMIELAAIVVFNEATVQVVENFLTTLTFNYGS